MPERRADRPIHESARNASSGPGGNEPRRKPRVMNSPMEVKDPKLEPTVKEAKPPKMQAPTPPGAAPSRPPRPSLQLKDQEVVDMLNHFNQSVNVLAESGRALVDKAGGFAVLERLREFNRTLEKGAVGSGHWGHKSSNGVRGGSCPGNGGVNRHNPKLHPLIFNGNDPNTFWRFVREHFAPEKAREIRLAVVQSAPWCGSFQEFALGGGLMNVTGGRALGINLPAGFNDPNFRFPNCPCYEVKGAKIFIGERV